MLTAQQLYEIFNKKDEQLGAGEQPYKKAAGALHALREKYKNRETLPDAGEEAFAAALCQMLDKAEQSIGRGDDADAFRQALEPEVSAFRTAGGNLTGALRRQNGLREAFADMAALEPDRLACHRAIGTLMEHIVRENNIVKQIRANTYPGQTRANPMPREQIDGLEKTNEQALKNDLAILLAMDSLRKEGNLAAAMDPNLRKATTEKVRQSGQFKALWVVVDQQAMDENGLAKALQDARRPELAELVAPAARTVEALEQEDAELKFRQSFQELAESAVRTFALIRPISEGVHLPENLSQDDLDEMRENNIERLRATVATLAAMDGFRKKGDFASAIHPERLEADTERIMREKATELDLIMTPLTSRAGSADLSTVLDTSKLKDLSILLAVAQKSVEQKDRQAARAAGAENAASQPEQNMAEPEPVSPALRFDAKLAALKQAADGQARDAGQFRQGLQELFALRDLMQTDPDTPVTDWQVQEQVERARRETGEAQRLYQSVLRLNLYRLEKVAKAITGSETAEQFRNTVMTAAELTKAPTAPITTTAQDVYDDLTKRYKAGRMDYTQYESMLKTMRELTGGNKQEKIDIRTIENAINEKLQASRGPVENEVRRQMGNTFDGKIGHRLRGIYDLYGLTPKLNEKSIQRKGYSMEQFHLLKTFEDREGERLRIVPDRTVSDAEFTALAVAATQADPKLGGFYFVKNKKTGELGNLLKDPTADDAAAVRTLYTTDVFRDADSAREHMGDYIQPIVAPARERAADALRKFKAGEGSAKKLGEIIGKGLHNMMESASLLDGDSTEILADNALDGAIIGTLAGMLEESPALMNAASAYVNKEEIQKAKGLKAVYDIVRAAGEARERMKEAVKNQKPLAEPERTACVELMLRERLLLINGRNQIRQNKAIAEEKERLSNEHEEKLEKTDDMDEKTFLSIKHTYSMLKVCGLPDYVKTLGREGPDFAGTMLDKVLPNRDAFSSRATTRS